MAWEGPRGWHLVLALLPTCLVAYALLVTLPRRSSEPRLAWADEFNGASLDTSKWSFMQGDGTIYGIQPGWGNQEIQCYVNGSDVLSIIPDPDNPSSNSVLAITAHYSQGSPCYNGQTAPASSRDWVSARISTWGKASFAPSPTAGIMVQARVKVPMVQGSFPAFWMLPDPSTTPYGIWCASGEIDIMEHVNLEQEMHGTIHYGGGGSGTANCQRREGITSVPNPGEWHVHAVMWTTSQISWLVDGVEYFRATSNQWWSANDNGAPGAPFNAPFYVLLNLAVGGVWAGPPASTVPFQYLADYVRVWEVPLGTSGGQPQGRRLLSR